MEHRSRAARAPLAALVLAGAWLAGGAAPARAQAPTITSVQPGTGPAAGGIPLTINGSNFGAAGGTVRVQGRDVGVPAGAAWAPSRVLVMLPAGDPGPAPVTVQPAGGPESAPWNGFSYQPPSIFALDPTGGPSAGGYVITVTGANFGTGTAPAAVEFGTTAAPATVVSNTELHATVPELPPGTTVNVRVVINGQASGFLPFTVQGPQVGFFHPANGPTQGGTIITILGNNFGSAADPVPVAKFGGLVSPAVTRVSQNEIHAALPEGSGAGRSVEVHVGGAMSPPGPNLFSYFPPQIAALDPPAGIAAGGVRLTITGQDFGPPGTMRELDLQPLGGGVVIHGAINGPEDHGRLEADLPGLSPGDYALMLLVDGQPSNVMPYVVSSVPLVGGVSLPGSPTQGGVLLTVTGQNFGADGGLVRVQGRDVPVPAGPAWAPTAIVFPLPEGDPGPAPIEVHPTFGPGSLPFDGFAYDPPSLASLEPPGGPAAGGTVITIHGLNFGTAGATRVARMGGKIALCTRLGHTALEVVAPDLPPGLVVPVEVEIDGIPAGPLPYQVEPPLVGSVFPATGPTLGGIQLTVIGQNFGATDDPLPVVHVGPFVAGNVERLAPGMIRCTLPPGSGLDRSVQVDVGGAMGPPSPAHVDYAPPSVFGLDPPGGPAVGGVLLTIHGANFGPPGSTPRQVRVVDALGAEVVFPVDDGASGQSQVVCTTMPTAPGVASVFVTIDGQEASPVAYDATGGAPPMLTSLSSPSGPTQGNVPITIIGQGFGATPGIVRFGPFPAPLVDWSDVMIEALTPEAWSGLFPVTVERADAMPGQNALPYEYAPPKLGIPSPSLLDPAGGQVITITGQNFGRADAPRTITVGGAPVALAQWFGHNALTVLSPPGTAGALVPLCMSLPGVGPVCVDVQYGNPVGVAPPAVPVAFGLRLAGPNPTRGDVAFAVDLPRDARYRLRVFDSAGRVVRAYEADAAAGTQLVRWDGADARGARAPAGLYWARLDVAGGKFVKKVLRL